MELTDFIVTGMEDTKDVEIRKKNTLIKESLKEVTIFTKDQSLQIVVNTIYYTETENQTLHQDHQKDLE